MKKTIIQSIVSISLNACFIAVNAQSANNSYYRQCVGFSISRPLSELAAQFPVVQDPSAEPIEAEDGFGRNVNANEKSRAVESNNSLATGTDPAVQTNNGIKTMGAPLVNFNGITDLRYVPCDPSGAAGPNHFVQSVNSSYCVFDKTGKPLFANPLDLTTLWPGSSTSTDCVVMYDRFADRWFIGRAAPQSTTIYIAVSTTPDPTGTYYLYTFQPFSAFPDYPKFSIWSDGYYQTTDLYPQSIVVYDRTKMLTGDKTAGMIVQTLPTPTNDFVPYKLALDADGQLPPYGTPNYVVGLLDSSYLKTQGVNAKSELMLYKVAVDWTGKTAAVTLDQQLPVAPFNGVFGANGPNNYGIKQPGTTQLLTSFEQSILYRVPYMRWTGYNSALISHVVNAGNGVAGVRWYEIRQNESTKVWTVYQQGTYAPSDGISRWVPSIAMNVNGDIGLGYAVSNSSSVYPGLRYTGRLAGDPLGQMTFAEQKVIDGGGTETTVGRFGDYSQTTIDPDGITFWCTAEYFRAGAPNPKYPQTTRIYSYQLSNATGIKENPNLPDLAVSRLNNSLNIKVNNLSSDDKLSVDLFDISGKLIDGKQVNPTANKLETTVDINNLPAGVYLVRVGGSAFQRVVKVAVN